MKLTIKVTQDHIDRGEVDDCLCPIGLACTDAGLRNHTIKCDPPRLALWIDRSRRLHEGKPQWECKLPNDAKMFVTDFDNLEREGHYVEPIEFDVEIPDRFIIPVVST